MRTEVSVELRGPAWLCKAGVELIPDVFDELPRIHLSIGIDEHNGPRIRDCQAERASH